MRNLQGNIRFPRLLLFSILHYPTVLLGFLRDAAEAGAKYQGIIRESDTATAD
jgi:hypothetical protein